jgi:hypothetical protein
VERAAPPEFRARADASVMSVSESLESKFRCPECGAILGVRPVLYRPLTRLYDTGGSCASCYLASGKHEGGIVAIGRDLGGSEELEEQHTRLFEAARALLQYRTVGEDEIFPTLKLASKLGRPRFRLMYRGVEMVRVVDEVPILRRNPVLAGGVSSIRSAGEAVTAVIITVTASRRAVGADDVARAYEQVLREEGMAWGGSGGQFTYFLASDMLQLEVMEFDEFGAIGAERRWPEPATIGRFARAALDEFGESLILRKGGGGDMGSDNLIFAMVARVLADEVPRKGGKINRKEVHRLLDMHLLPGASWRRPLSDGDPDGERRLWDNVKKVGRMEELYEPGPMSVS